MNQLAEQLDEKLRTLDPARAQYLESLVRDALDRAEQDESCDSASGHFEQTTVAVEGEGVERPTQGELPYIEWTDERNARRCALIDRKIQGALTEDEAEELEKLQEAMRRHVNHVAPLPFEAARQLHAELLKKQQAKQ